jgi:hypothetical protein
VGQAARSVESGAGLSLGELIDFCARCAALGIPESTKLRAVSSAQQMLVALTAESPQASAPELVHRSASEFGTIIENGMHIDIPGEE